MWVWWSRLRECSSAGARLWVAVSGPEVAKARAWTRTMCAQVCSVKERLDVEQQTRAIKGGCVVRAWRDRGGLYRTSAFGGGSKKIDGLVVRIPAVEYSHPRTGTGITRKPPLASYQPLPTSRISHDGAQSAPDRCVRRRRWRCRGWAGASGSREIDGGRENEILLVFSNAYRGRR